MFKKVELWILCLVAYICIIFAFGFGALVRQELVGSTKLGWVSKAALNISEIPLNTYRLFKKDMKLVDRFPKLDGFNGTGNLEESYLLLARYDGNLGEGVVELVDLTNFKILHTWNPNIDLFNHFVNKEGVFKYIVRDSKNSRSRLLHPKLTQDGGLLFTEDSPLRKIDACSNLIFQNMQNKFHHAIEIDIDGNIWAPIRLYPQSLSNESIGRSLREEGGFHDDAIAKLSNDGQFLYKKSVAQIFIDNGLEYLLFSVGDRHFDKDPIHLNDIQPVNTDGQFWNKGDLFLSLRHQSMVLLYRPKTNEIIWKGVGPFFHQHDVDILDDQRISIFNNNSKDFINGDVIDDHNEVIVYDFSTNLYSSYLKDSLYKNDVRTVTGGQSQILPNGDLFIEETNYSRSLFFNADGSLRWSFVNRADDGNVYDSAGSRILYTQEDVKIVNNFLANKPACNE